MSEAATDFPKTLAASLLSLHLYNLLPTLSFLMWCNDGGSFFC